jgi:hypothetical protein
LFKAFLFIVQCSKQEMAKQYLSHTKRASDYKYQYADGTDITRGDIVQCSVGPADRTYTLKQGNGTDRDDPSLGKQGDGTDRNDPSLGIIDSNTGQSRIERASTLTLVCGDNFSQCECVEHKRVAGWEITGWNSRIGRQGFELEQDESNPDITPDITTRYY